MAELDLLLEDLARAEEPSAPDNEEPPAASGEEPSATDKEVTYVLGALPVAQTVAAKWLDWCSKKLERVVFEQHFPRATSQGSTGPTVRICRPPVPDHLFPALAAVLRTESFFFEERAHRLLALDAACMLDSSAADWIVEEMAMRLRHSAQLNRPSEGARRPLVDGAREPREYLRASGAAPEPAADAYAHCRAWVRTRPDFGELPPARNEREESALLEAVRLLHERGRVVAAGELAEAALRSPLMFGVFEKLQAHLVPPFSEFRDSFLRLLLAQECAGAFPYLFTLQDLVRLGCPNVPLTEAQARGRLDAFVGGYLSDLDLRETHVTGSALSAALLVTGLERRAFGGRYHAYLKSHYPTKLTRPDDYAAYRQHAAKFHDASWRYDAAQAEIVLHSPHAPQVRLAVRSGSDVDLAVVVPTRARFVEWVERHAETVRAHYPGVECTLDGVRDRAQLTHPVDPTFRTVELYRVDSELHYTTHHVAMVRAVYTRHGFQTRAPSFLYSAAHLKTPFYSIFASKKAENAPHEIIAKYCSRGFLLDSRTPRAVLQELRELVGGWPCEPYPARAGARNFSFFALESELAQTRQRSAARDTRPHPNLA
jgi:hypothetical protein